MNTRLEITDLTVCRGIFAAWVFTYHVDLYLNFSAYLGPFAALIRRGYLGVDGFFLLSGLILSRVHQQLPLFTPETVKFYGKRLARIYPVHMATIAILALLVLAGTARGLAPHDPSRFSGLTLLQNLLLIHGWGVSPDGDWNYPSWSISTEWAGYLLFPILVWAVRYFDGFVAVQMILACAVVEGLIFYLFHNSANITYTGGLLRFFPEFVGGMFIARIVPWLADEAPLPIFLAVGIAVLLASVLSRIDLFSVIGLAIILYTLTMRSDAERPPFFWRARTLRRFGRLSYAFYMSFAVAEFVLVNLYRAAGWTPPGHPFIYASGMVLATFALSTALHILVENPARRAADRWLDGSSGGG